MARTSWWWVAAMALAVVACSGGRDEKVSCEDVSQCRDGSQCLNGFCVSTDEALAATADSVGADIEIPVLIIDGAGNTCEAQSCTGLPFGTQVTFRAGSAPGYRFTGWSGSAECVGTAIDLVIPSLSHDTHCDANYVKRVKVAAHTSGAEGGVIASSDTPFASCNGGVCEVDVGQPVQLRAEDRFGQRFSGWSGTGCGSATTFETTVIPTGDLLCVANFVERIVVSGTAMNAPTTIDVASEGAVCEPGSCILDKGGNATLTAPVVPKFRFAGWSGSDGCSGTEPTLRFSDLQQSENCLATYTPRVTVSGSSSGALPLPAITAVSSDLYAACDGPACDTDVGGGVTLLASSAPGFRLTGWTGPACEAEKGAAVELTNVSADTQCVATYAQGVAVIGAVVGAPGEVTATSNTTGAICSEGACVIDLGGDVTLSAPSPAGYRFLGWDGDEGCASTALTVGFPTVTQSKTCYARYAARFLVRGTVSPTAGGTVAAASTSAGASCQGEGCTVDAGSEVALTVTPSAGFRFSGWSGGGACTGTNLTVRVPNVTGNTTCQANFIGRFTVAGIAAPAGGGTVVASSDSGAATCTGAMCQVDRGSRVALTATAADGYRFSAWSGCTGAGSGATLSLENVSQDMACRATFTPLRYTVASTVAPAGSGSVRATATAGNPQCADGQCSVDHGTAVTLTATPSAGWRFGSWAGCSTSDEATITLPSARANATCQARFQRILFTVTAAFTPDNGGSVAITATGTGTCTGLRCTVPYGGGANLSARPASGWDFGGWSGCSTSMEAALALTDVTASTTCTANFTRQRFVVAGTPRPSAGGSVAAASSAQGAVCADNRCTVNYGSAVSLSATPAAGYEFTSWTGCMSSTAATINVSNVTAAVTCTANFTPLRLTVTGIAGTGGAVAATSATGDCDDNVCTVEYGGAVALMAVPATGYEFTGWTMCPVMGDSALLAIPNVTMNTRCTAVFRRRVFRVVGSATPAGSGTVSVAAMTSAQCTGAACNVNYGGSVTFEAEPATGYNLSGWSGDCTELANNPARATITNVTAAGTCVATFTQRVLRVVGVAGSGGTVGSPSATPGTCTSGNVCNVNYGGSVSFTATPLPGWAFAGWTGACTASPTNPLVGTDASVTAAGTCTASFRQLSYTVTGAVSPSGPGRVTASAGGTNCTGAACTVLSGTVVTLTAVEASSRFRGWSCTNGATSAELTLNVTANANVTCTADFVGRVTISARPEIANGGPVTITGGNAVCRGNSCVVDQGSTVTLSVPAFSFQRWESDDQSTATCPVADVPDATTSFTATTNAACVAVFYIIG